MAKYQRELPALHLTTDELEDLLQVLSEGMDLEKDYNEALQVQVTSGNLTKSYGSLSNIRNDETLPDDLKNVTITLGTSTERIRMYWDSSNMIPISKLTIRGDEDFVKSKKDDLDRFLENNKIRWRSVIDNAYIMGIVGGVVAGGAAYINETFLKSAFPLFLVLLFGSGLALALYAGMNILYPKNLLARNRESARVQYAKKFTKYIMTLIMVVASGITIFRHLNSP